MEEKKIIVTDAEINSINGGCVNPDWSKGMKSKHEGEICPDCGVCYLEFVQFQDFDGIREEVCYCSCCDYIIFKV